MIRLISTTIFLSFFTYSSLVKPASAGFEWVPPMQNPSVVAPDSVSVENNIAAPSMNMNGGFPAPAVSAEPLVDNSADHSMTRIPTSILSNQQYEQKYKASRASEPKVVAAPVKKNLSGKKLVIDPYPLRNSQVPLKKQASMTEIYKAVNEEAGNLHPVRLGNGMNTGARTQKTVAVPKAVRMASTAHKTFLTPTGDGMTPMMGAEPAPLSGMATSRHPVEKVVPSIKYAEAVGFGRDLPLALALSQVIPSEFTHSYAIGVDAGVSVSWEGGKPWDQVLHDMLSAQNLTAVIQGDQVIIQNTARL